MYDADPVIRMRSRWVPQVRIKVEAWWLPAILNGLRKGHKKVAGDIEDFELGKATNRVGQRLQLVRMHVQYLQV